MEQKLNSSTNVDLSTSAQLLQMQCSVQLLRTGATRWVILIGQFAFKIPSLRSWRNFLWGLLANMQEVEFSKCNEMKHKLCPEYFETMFDLYRKSAERKEILRLFEVDEERKLPEKSAPTKEQRLSECKAHFKLYGKIDYRDGKVYLDNFDQIKEILGEEVLNELKQQAKENLINECQNNILKKIDVTESKNILDQFESGEYFALWKVETRKLHLAEWFKNMEMADL